MLSTSAEMVIYFLFIGSTICYYYCYVLERTIDHFTVAWPLNESEARVDFVCNRKLPAFLVLMMHGN